KRPVGSLPPSKPLTGPAPPRRSVCARRWAAAVMIRRTTSKLRDTKGVALSVVEFEGQQESAAAPPERNGAVPTREVRHEYTRPLPPLLSQLGVSLLVSTYQAGKVVAVGVAQGELTLSYHNFERAMGLAVKPDGLAVAARAQVWFLRSAPDLAARVEPA